MSNIILPNDFYVLKFLNSMSQWEGPIAKVNRSIWTNDNTIFREFYYANDYQ
jgi:hypothetical protein